MRRRLAALAAVLVTAVVACQFVVGIERTDKVAAVAADAADEGVVTADAGPPDPCPHTGPIKAPSVDDAPTVELPTFVLAVDAVQLSGTAGGFDLDGVCTCDSRPGSSRGGVASCEAKKNCDDNQGIDNQSSELFANLSPTGNIDDVAGVNPDIQRGRRTILLFLRKYNGRANDREVEVGLAVSDGVREIGCPTSTKDQVSGYVTPGWCGNDKWTVLPGLVKNGFPVSYNAGYVNDYRMVVQLDRAATVPFGDLGLEFGSPVSVGKIVPLGVDLKPRDASRPPAAGEERLFAIEGGILAGRMTSAGLLAAAGTLELAGPDGGRQPLCQNGLFLAIKTRICESVDIARSRSFDFQPGYTCDAISSAMGYSARPALLGPEFQSTVTQNGCSPVGDKPRDPSPYVTTYACSGADAGQ